MSNDWERTQHYQNMEEHASDTNQRLNEQNELIREQLAHARSVEARRQRERQIDIWAQAISETGINYGVAHQIATQQMEFNDLYWAYPRSLQNAQKTLTEKTSPRSTDIAKLHVVMGSIVGAYWLLSFAVAQMKDATGYFLALMAFVLLDIRLGHFGVDPKSKILSRFPEGIRKLLSKPYEKYTAKKSTQATAAVSKHADFLISYYERAHGLNNATYWQNNEFFEELEAEIQKYSEEWKPSGKSSKKTKSNKGVASKKKVAGENSKASDTETACPICNMEAANLERHLDLLHDLVVCPSCGLEFSGILALEAHKNAAHGPN